MREHDPSAGRDATTSALLRIEDMQRKQQQQIDGLQVQLSAIAAKLGAPQLKKAFKRTNSGKAMERTDSQTGLLPDTLKKNKASGGKPSGVSDSDWIADQQTRVVV